MTLVHSSPGMTLALPWLMRQRAERGMDPDFLSGFGLGKPPGTTLVLQVGYETQGKASGKNCFTRKPLCNSMSTFDMHMIYYN